MSIKPPQDAPVWDHTAEQIVSSVKDSVAKHKAAMDKVAALAPKDANFKSVRCYLALL